jgi:hypothetical protein
MNQLTLFDRPAQIARKSDPITSHQSAAETQKKLTRLHTAFFEMLKFQCDARKKSVTANEVAAACVLAFEEVANRETWRKRAGELASEEYGCLIVADGTRRCEMTGKSARTFKVKEQP